MDGQGKKKKVLEEKQGYTATFVKRYRSGIFTITLKFRQCSFIFLNFWLGSSGKDWSWGRGWLTPDGSTGLELDSELKAGSELKSSNIIGRTKGETAVGRRNREGSTRETGEAWREHGIMEAREESSLRKMESSAVAVAPERPTEMRTKRCLLNVAT